MPFADHRIEFPIAEATLLLNYRRTLFDADLIDKCPSFIVFAIAFATFAAAP